jgi:tetratricopeptide (TPR) repeat protein
LQQSSHAAELLNSARIEFQNGHYEKAASLLLAATNENERLLGSNSLEVLEGLEMLGDAYLGMGQYNDAATTYQRVIEIKEKVVGPNYLAIANLLVKVAKCYECAGNTEVAQFCYDQALTLCEARLPPKHPFVAEVLEHYANLLHSTGADPAKIHAFERIMQQLTGRNPSEGEPAEPREPINLTPHQPKLRARDFKQSTFKQMAVDEMQGVIRDKWQILAAIVVLALVLWICYMIQTTAMHSSLPPH